MNPILDSVVTITRYKKTTIYRVIYIKNFYDETVYYLSFYTDDDLKTADNETYVADLIRVSEEAFKIKFQEVFVFKYLILEFFSPLLVSLFIRPITSWK